jgi:hypothetical protein
MPYSVITILWILSIIVNWLKKYTCRKNKPDIDHHFVNSINYQTMQYMYVCTVMWRPLCLLTDGQQFWTQWTNHLRGLHVGQKAKSTINFWKSLHVHEPIDQLAPGIPRVPVYGYWPAEFLWKTLIPWPATSMPGWLPQNYKMVALSIFQSRPHPKAWHRPTILCWFLFEPCDVVVEAPGIYQVWARATTNCGSRG